MDFSEEMHDEILKIFQVESEEIISRLINSLLELEKKPNNKDAILLLFRDAHTLKGASRMVGFGNVQTIAHKIEDILGLAKDNEILLNSKIVDVLYKAIDFLSVFIQESIENTKEIYTEEINKQIYALESVKDFADEADSKSDQVDFDINLLNDNVQNINNLIAQSLFLLMKMESENSQELMEQLFHAVKELYDIFQKIGMFEIKECLGDISMKLEIVIKSSSSLNSSELDQIHQTLDQVINKLFPLFELYNIEVVDYYSMAFNKMSETPYIEKGEETVASDFIEHIEEEIIDVNVGEWGYIQGLVSTLSQNYNSLNEIKEYLIEFEKSCDDDIVKNILKNILDIFDFISENQIQIDEETTSVLRQSLEHCENIINNEGEDADEELVLQRLGIIRQVLEFNKVKDEDDFSFITQTDHKVKKKKPADFSAIFNTGEIKTLRVDSEKLDELVNQVSELSVTKIKTQKHIHELNIINKEMEEWQKNSIKALNFLKYYDKKYFQAESSDNSISFFVKQLVGLFVENNKKVQETVSNISNLSRTIQEDDTKMTLVVDDLDHMIKNIRVLPLATVFHLFGRMVRDIAQEKNKQIELEIFGSETSTDKKIIEEIKAPLIHIIRNAIDHGIELPKDREALGKNPTGKIILRARQASNKVIIEIEDDGKGINIEKVKEKALQKGYLNEEEINSMTDEQIMNLIFAPGFSTGDEITNISGRGIGLDVVQSKISQLNGKVKIISEINKGCCVQIELPNTMSTMKAFLVKSSNQTFAIPMFVINTVLRKNKDEIVSNQGGRAIIFKEKTVPLYNLSDILSLEKSVSTSDKETILVIETDNKVIALSVDKLIGDQEILHKKLAAPLYRLKNISGITTLISGEVCLILNISDILKSVTKIPQIQSTVQAELRNPKNSEYRILLVDDSITTRTLEKNILTKIGYNVDIAENPIEAFEKMKSTRFDLIISDIEMPEMDGFQFLEKLKTDEMFFEIPVIMVSSLITEENKRRAMDLGAKKYIVKGEFEQDDFQETITKILHKD